MLNKKTSAILLLSLSFMLLSTGCKKKTEESSSNNTQEQAMEAKPPKVEKKNLLKRYDVEAATVKFNVSGSLQNGTEELVFDQYGIREMKTTNTEFAVAGITQKTSQMVLTEGDKIHSADLATKSGTVIQNPLYQNIVDLSKQKDLKDFGEAMMKQLGGKKTGSDTVAGKDCEVWEIASLGSTSCVWKGVTLRTVSKIAGVDVLIEATEVNEGSVPDSAFEFPADINFDSQKSAEAQKILDQFMNQ